MIVSIHQPAYLPWMGYFDKIASADKFIYLDTVQFQKQSFQNRNKIRTKEGWIWLTVPVETKGKLFTTELKDLSINNKANWNKKHLAAIKQNYSKASQFKTIYPIFEEFYKKEWTHLSDICFEMMVVFNELLGIKTEIIKASDLQETDAQKSFLVLELCKTMKADAYLSGALGRDYLEEETFEQADIKITYQDYKHPEYQQVYKGFEPYMGIVDILMNEKNPKHFFRKDS